MDLFVLPELNQSDVTVLCASPELLTDFGKGCFVGECVRKTGVSKIERGENELLDEYFKGKILYNNKVFSPSLFKGNITFGYFVEMCLNNQSIRGVKTVMCENVEDVISQVSFDVFALYVNRSNLCYVGYYNKDDKEISRGCIRELRDTVLDLSQVELCERFNNKKTTDVSAILNRLSLSLVTYVQSAE